MQIKEKDIKEWVQEKSGIKQKQNWLPKMVSTIDGLVKSMACVCWLGSFQFKKLKKKETNYYNNNEWEIEL